MLKLRKRSDPNRRWNLQVFSVLSGYSLSFRIPGSPGSHQFRSPEKTTISECFLCESFLSQHPRPAGWTVLKAIVPIALAMSSDPFPEVVECEGNAVSN